jgi:glycosyltransferase involved in cell wall biosynthesis
LVSVVVPAFNCAEYLGQCLADLAAQTYGKLQIIVVDDGSLDETPRVAERFAGRDARVSVVRTSNHGPSHARNIGWERAEGAWVWFVDADDRVRLDAVELLLECALAQEPDFVVANVVPFDEQGVLPRESCLPRPFPAEERSDGKALMGHILRGALGGYAVQFFTNRRVLERLESDGALFPPDIRMFEDVPYALRLAAAVHAVSYVQEPLYFYRQRQTSAAHRLSPDAIRQGMAAAELVEQSDVPLGLRPLRNECVCRLYLYLYESDRCGRKTAAFRREVRSRIFRLAEEDDTGFSRTVRIKVRLLRMRVLRPVGWLVRRSRAILRRVRGREGQGQGRDIPAAAERPSRADEAGGYPTSDAGRYPTGDAGRYPTGGADRRETGEVDE